MAPERAERAAVASFGAEAKADVYSFGVVLWELGTAQPPFKGLSEIQARRGRTARRAAYAHHHLRVPRTHPAPSAAPCCSPRAQILRAVDRSERPAPLPAAGNLPQGALDLMQECWSQRRAPGAQRPRPAAARCVLRACWVVPPAWRGAAAADWELCLLRRCGRAQAGLTIGPTSTPW